jgi:hypothetical protein
MGFVDGTMQLGGLFSGSANEVDEELAVLFGDDVEDIVTVAPEGLVAGRRVIGFASHESNYQIQGSVSDVVAVQATLQATGGIKSGWSLHDLAAETATVSTTTGVNPSIDNTATIFYPSGEAGASNGGGWGILQVTAVSGTASPTLTVKIQDSADNATFADMVTFTAVVNTTGSQRLALPTIVRRYVRTIWTITGTNPSFTFHVNFERGASPIPNV